MQLFCNFSFVLFFQKGRALARKSKIADLKSHNLHETSKAAALIKNKGTDTACFVLEVCKRQGNNILCAICQV